MPDNLLDDYNWLISEAAAPFLEFAADANIPIYRRARELQKAIGDVRGQLVLDQAELRKKGLAKFSDAAQMFFTRKGLEQATDQWLAQYKAQRFSKASRIVDLCCGVGGDLRYLARLAPSIGFELDGPTAVLAGGNGIPDASYQVTNTDAASWLPEPGDYWHADPDRRSAGKRHSQVAGYQPGEEQILKWFAKAPHGAVKIAPAAIPPDNWLDYEIEYLGTQGECRQQMIWSGDLAEYPQRTRATIIAPDDSSPRSVIGDHAVAEFAGAVEGYIYEPHSAVLAARLTDDLAAQLNLRRIERSVVYLTGDSEVLDPAVATFQVLKVLAFDQKKLRKEIRELGWSQLEIKRRGVEFDLEKLRKKLKCDGAERGVLLVFRGKQRATAVLAKRVIR
ncbi:MAG: hypothetical protein ACI9HK_004031 [Pirellulaceae bacterium]